jgi:uncharacterized membrane protein
MGPMGVSVRVATREPLLTQSTRDREGSEIEFSRVVAFSDGVFAIAITLLVLALEIPAGVDDLGQALRDRSDEFFAYGLSFAVIGSLWIDHHRFFGGLRAFDGRLMGLNLLYLAFVALVPFSSSLLGSYAGQSPAVVAYALNMVLISVTFTLQIDYAGRRGLIAAGSEYDRGLSAESIVIPAVFAISIPVALVAPQQTPYVWLAIPILMRVVAARRKRLSAR